MNAAMTILRLLPSILAAIKAMEEFLPDNTPGKQKLDAVLKIITDVDSSLSPLVPQLTGTITTLVTLLRATGVFKSKAATDTSAQ